MYVSNLFLYLNYHPVNDFVVNLDNVSEAAGVFVLPGEVEPKMLKAGETWLAPWEISGVNANFVTWVNTEDNTEVKQRLF